MRTPALLRFRKLGLLALLALAQPASATITLTFSTDGIGRATGFSNSSASAGVNGLRWGIVVSTVDSTFANAYDGGFNINTSGFLKVNGVDTDDYYVAHPDSTTTLPTDATSTTGGTDPGGNGSITGMASVPYDNLALNRPFQLIWFEGGSAVGDNYGTLGNTGGTGTFVLPADGDTEDYTAFFAGATADPVRGATSIFRSGVAGEPEIIVHQPSGTNVPDDGTVNFGATAVNTSVDRIFTVKNAGNANLEPISYSIIGTDASAFSIQGSPATNLTTAASTQLTVRYTPTTTGSKTATLRIVSNDTDEGTYDITLNGTTPSEVIFERLSFMVDEDVVGGEASFVLERRGDLSGTSTVYYSTVPGTGANGATGGATATGTADYENRIAIAVTFLPTEQYKVVTDIAINNDSATVEPNQTFSVKLLTAVPNAPVGALIGTPNTANITIVDASSKSNDLVNPPMPSVSYPTEKALVGVPTDGTLNVTGTATDLKGVQFVDYRLLPATGSPPAFVSTAPEHLLGTIGGASTTFSIPIIPVTGKNRIEIRSRDFRTPTPNTSASIIREFTVTRALPIGIAGTGTGTITTGYSPTSFREVGKSYTVVASPQAASGIEPGSIFTGWTLGGSDVAMGNAALTNANASRIGVAQSSLVKQSLTFIFREGMTLTANFERNTYPARSGTYNGLVETTSIGDGVSLASTEGFFNAELMTTGGFSGKLTIDGFVLNVSGLFDASGVARFGTARTDEVVVARTGKPSLKVKLNASTSAPFKITGTVTQVGFQQSKVVGTSVIEADRAYYGKQVLTGKILEKGNPAGHTRIQLPSAEGRTEVIELVTGTGIPVNATITDVDAGTQVITINKLATGALNSTLSLTFTRDVPDAYLTVNGATKTNGALTMVLPPKDPYYSRPGSFDEGTDIFTPDAVTANEFTDGDAIGFVDDGNLPARLTGANADHVYEVITKSGNTFQIWDDTDSEIVDLAADVDLEIILEPNVRQQLAGYERADFPQGYSYGTVSVTKTGVVSYTTTLADGTTVFTASSTISQPDPGSDPENHDGYVALFAPLYNKLGFISGSIRLKDNDESDMDASNVKWMRPAQSTSHYYPAGWPGAITVGLQAAKFSVAPAATPKSTLRAQNGDDIETVDTEGDGNAALLFGDGALTEDLLKNVMLSPTDVVVKVPDNDPTFTLTVAHATGVLGGTFIHTDDTVPTIKGIIYQKGPLARGFGFFLTKQVVLDYTGESGWVELIGEGQ